MALFNVTNNITLRGFYKDYRNLTQRSKRADETKGTLSYADSMALHRAAKAIQDYDFSDKTTSKEKLQAFIDTYNYTMESSKSSGNVSVSSSYNSIKKLTKDYTSELENIGIRADSNGYLKLSTSAVENIKSEKFQKVLGKDSEFMKKLGSYAKRIANHVDITL